MSDLDLERLGEMWRAEPDPAEMETLRRSAQTVARRARLGQITDGAIAAVVCAAIIVLAVSNPAPAVLLIGAVTVAAIIASQVRNRRLREAELRSLSGNAEEMLEQSIERARATLKRARRGLFGAPVGILLGLGMGLALESGRGSILLAKVATDPWLSIGVPAAVLLVLGLLALNLLGAARNAQRELVHLTEIRRSWQDDVSGNGPHRV